MKKILYFDCFSGISGDMTLAALLDLGIDREQFIAELNKLNLHGYNINFDRISKKDIGAYNVDIVIDDSHNHEHRGLSDITKIIITSDLSDKVKAIAINIFKRIAFAEAKIHQTTVEEIHFHEIGAIDSIIDVVGAAICIDILSPDYIYSSVINDGYGFINCQHGVIPVPVPATIEILSQSEAKLRQINIDTELVTPTGAAIIAELTETCSDIPTMDITRIGYGAGKKDLSIPNVLRVIMGESSDEDKANSSDDNIIMLETNIDDCTAEILGYTMDKLFESGAKDVYFTSIQMKKNRPATKLSVLCTENTIKQMEDIIFTETTSLGVRKYKVERTTLPFSKETIDTKYGKLDVKISEYNGNKKTAVEYESAKKLAEESGVNIQDVMKLV